MTNLSVLLTELSFTSTNENLIIVNMSCAENASGAGPQFYSKKDGGLPASLHTEANRVNLLAGGVKVNPFSAEQSGYGHKVDGKFVSVYPPGSDMHRFHIEAQARVDAFIKGETFPCILGQNAIRTDQYSFSAYNDITDPQVAEGVLHDLVRFQEEFEVPDKPKGKRGIFRSALVAFKSPVIEEELQGAEVLYTLLGNMHKLNSLHYDWPEGFSNDISSPDFGFAAGRSAHFIAYFHPVASWPARVSDVQFIVFNSHHVVDAFKATGMDNHARAKAIIRSRQPQPIHPYLGNHRDVEEWRQYALLPPTEEMEAKEGELRKRILGECPFQPKSAKIEKT